MQLAKLIGDIATGQVQDVPAEDKRNPAAVELGSKGGKARAKNLSSAKKKAQAKRAAKARWENRPSK